MIKRLLLSLAVALAALAASAQNRQLVLSHAGALSFFSLTDMDAALTAAQANDTIFLPDCNIPGFKIDKPVTILGTGRNCIINGDIEIELKDPNQTVTNALLDGLNVWGSVNFKDNTTPGTYHVRYCRMNRLYAGKGSTPATSDEGFATGIAENMPNLIVESCSVYYRSSSSEGNGMMLGPGTKSAFIFNSFVGNVWGSAPSGAVNYEYCNIYGLVYYSSKNSSTSTAYSYGNLCATLNKCIIKNVSSGATSSVNIFNSRIDNSSVANNTSLSSTNRVNCYTTSSSSNAFPTTNVTEWTYTLDGETIGDLGGTSPYSDKPSLPTITQSSVEMDAENRLVKISLKIDGGAPEETETPENPDQPENPENPETPETPAE